jgi:CHASE2 domain-containing sensor protein
MKRLQAVFFPPRRPLRWALPLAVLAGLVVLQILAPQWAGPVEDWTVDARFQLRGSEAPRNPIVIVAIDEDSVQSLGDLTGQNVRSWPRANWAELTSKLVQGRPRLIVLDVVFDTPGWDAGGDEALAAAMKQAGNVVLAANWDQREVEDRTLRILSPPVETLAQAAAGVGVANFPLDADGAVRRLTLLYPYGGKSYPALALVVAVLYQGAPIDVPPADLGSDLSVILHMRGPQQTFTTIPLDQVWSE